MNDETWARLRRARIDALHNSESRVIGDVSCIVVRPQEWTQLMLCIRMVLEDAIEE